LVRIVQASPAWRVQELRRRWGACMCLGMRNAARPGRWRAGGRAGYPADVGSEKPTKG
jgi:hypothetical protein